MIKKHTSLFNKILCFVLTVVCAVGVLGMTYRTNVPVYADETTQEKTEETTEEDKKPDISENKLKGTGSATNPFLIQNLQDLVYFRNTVNEGMDYSLCHVKQTVDIDLSLISNFVPIGTKENPFKGKYNGDGKVISNLNVNTDRAALFGYIDGEIRNLGIKGGTINGQYASSFVYLGSTESRIINCYSTARVIGSSRVSGIVDTFGEVYNCWYYSVLSGDISLIGYDATLVTSCFGVKITHSSTFRGTTDGCHEYKPYFFREKEFVDVLNLGRATVIANLYLKLTYLHPWAYVEDSTPVHATEERMWLGSGTKADPYQIVTPEDLVMLAVRTNTGTDFKSMFFQQMEDIDLAPVYNFVPIGIYDSNNYFHGTYDGGGHKISNLLIRSLPFSSNNGFFGKLGGTIRNTYFESGAVYGANCGSITSHGVDRTALILNCYSGVRVYGKSRSGGLVDNFTGKVLNCVYVNYLQQNILLCSYTAYEISHCYSTGGIHDPSVYKDDKSTIRDNDYITASTSWKIDEYVEKLNHNILDYARNYRLKLTDFARWEKSPDNVRLVFSGKFEPETIPESIQDLINKHYTDTLVIIKLVLCSAVVIALTIVLDVLVARHRKKKAEIAKKGK